MFLILNSNIKTIWRFSSLHIHPTVQYTWYTIFKVSLILQQKKNIQEIQKKKNSFLIGLTTFQCPLMLKSKIIELFLDIKYHYLPLPSLLILSLFSYVEKKRAKLIKAIDYVIYIYIYIYIESSTDRSVLFYQNSSVWLDILASRSWDRNPVDSNGNPRLFPSDSTWLWILIYIYIYIYIYIRHSAL